MRDLLVIKADIENEKRCEDESFSRDVTPEIIEAIGQVTLNLDQLDYSEFNSIEYINSLYPTEQSLCTIDDEISQLKRKIDSMDNHTRVIVRKQSKVSNDGRDALLDAQQAIRQMHLQTLEIKIKTEQTEETIKEITKDIKLLDCAKRNLTTAITTLSQLFMLIDGLNTLKVLIGKRKYGEILPYLQGTVEVMENLHDYAGIPVIRKLVEDVQRMKNSLSAQVTQEFHSALGGTTGNYPTQSTNLTNACLVVDVLDSSVRRDILSWFVALPLNEYTVLFDESEDDAWLDKIDRRYTWLKRNMIHCEEKFGSIFPNHWNVSQRIAIEFCQLTKTQLSKIMGKRSAEIDVKLLLYSIQTTASFEKWLALRFVENRVSVDNTYWKETPKIEDRLIRKRLTNADDSSENPFAEERGEEARVSESELKQEYFSFKSIIGECFMPYLYIYIENLDRNLFDLMEKFKSECKVDIKNAQRVSTSMHGVLPTSADLFVYFKRSLVQCNQLSNGQPLLSLCSTYKKYLTEYAVKILQNNLPTIYGNTISASLASINITRDLLDKPSTSSLIQSLFKDEAFVRFSKGEISRICCIMITAEYCIETTQQLEQKLKEKIHFSLVHQINFTEEVDNFHKIISNCIQLLEKDLLTKCEPALNVMSKTHWHTLVAVGDESLYVTMITSQLKSSVPLIRECLVPSRKYFTQLCIKFASTFISTFIENVYKCKPLSTVGAEQLLLDTHTLKTVLLGLPSISSAVDRTAPASYTRVVTKGMSRGEMILKVIMTPIGRDSYFVDQFMKLLPGGNIQELQKILEIKGIATGDRNNLLSIFRQRHPSTSGILQPAASFNLQY